MNNMGIRPDLRHYRFVIAPKGFFGELPERVKNDPLTLTLKKQLAGEDALCASASLEAYRLQVGK